MSQNGPDICRVCGKGFRDDDVIVTTLDGVIHGRCAPPAPRYRDGEPDDLDEPT
jgi:hypothetical protein